MSDLKRVTTMAQQLVDAEDRFKRLDAEAKEAKAEVERISTDDLPTLMAEVGLSEIKLEDGSKITIKEEVNAAITEQNAPAAMKWLADRGYDGIIKTSISLSFSREEREEAKSVAEELRNEHPAVELKEVVHPQTLKAFVKERLAAGEEVPFDLFSIHPYSKAKITRK